MRASHCLTHLPFRPARWAAAIALIASFATTLDETCIDTARAEAGQPAPPPRHAVYAPSKRYPLHPFASYSFADPALADRLNLLLAPLGWADEACDLAAYTAALAPANALIIDAIEKRGGSAKRNDDRDVANLVDLHEQLPFPPGPMDDLTKRWLAKHCRYYLNKETLEYDPSPKHNLAVGVPCPVVLRADRSAILWCERKVAFYSEAMKNAAAAALVPVRTAFYACKDVRRREDLAAALRALHRIYEAVVVPDDRSRRRHTASLIELYKLQDRQSLSDELMRADKEAVGSLAASLSEANSNKWCEKDFEVGPR